MCKGTKAAIAMLVVVIVGGLLLSACGGGGAVIQVTQKDSGSTVDAVVGDTIDVTLPENPSTGYSWKLQLSGGLNLIEDSYNKGDESGGLVGVPGTHNWQIEATEAGEQTITGEYRQAENPNDNPEYFSLKISVQ
jgi:inhibitor of cysteine peptidase